MRLDQWLVGKVSRKSRNALAEEIPQQGGVPFLRCFWINATEHVFEKARGLGTLGRFCVRAQAGLLLLNEGPGCDCQTKEECGHDSHGRRESDLMAPDSFLKLV